MKRVIPLLIVLSGALFFFMSTAQNRTAALPQQSPSLEYLGEGGSYSAGPGQHFIVKRTAPFVFVTIAGPDYDAAEGERVWAATVSAPPAVRPGTWIEYGTVPENCEVSYTAIDDDPDDRLNTFYVNGAAVHAMPQGLVTGGQFKTPEAGSLRLYAGDSIGVWVNKCRADEPTPTQQSTVTPTEQATATPTETQEPGVSPTATFTGTPGPSPTATATAAASDTPGAVQPTATPTRPTATTEPTATKKARLLSCLRINFEQGGDEAQEGIYEVRELGGRLLYSWYARAGWRDSGWIQGLDISFEDVYVQVFYTAEKQPPLTMSIVNPAAGTQYGWLTRGMCHALEVAWPDESVTPTPTPDAFDGFNDEFDRELLDLQRFIWPGVQPTPSSTPARSLRG